MASQQPLIVHGLIQTARGLCTDEADHREIDLMLALAVAQTKDIEAERDRYRKALEHLDQYVPPGWRQATIDIALGRVSTPGHSLIDHRND